MASAQRDILIEVANQEIANPGGLWTSALVLSDGIGDAVVAVSAANRPNFSAYVFQNTSGGVGVVDVVPLTVTSVTRPDGEEYYNAVATVQLNSDNFFVQVWNTDPSLDLFFNVSARVLTRSA